MTKAKAKKKPKGTTPTQVRLTAGDKAKIKLIRQRFGLPSMAAAIRYAVETTHRDIPPKKSWKESGNGA